MPSKKKSAIDNILGVSDGSANFEERMQSRTSSKTGESGEDSKSAGGSENSLRQQNPAQRPSEQSESGATQQEKVSRKRGANRRKAKTKAPVISELQLDTQTEQTTKASYYLSSKQAKRLDDLRSVFRYDGGYTPRDASYSRIVGLAIDRLHEEVFRPESSD